MASGKLKTPLPCGLCSCGCGTQLYTNWSGQFPKYVNGHARRIPGGFPDGVKIDPEDAEKWKHLHWRITVKRSKKGVRRDGYVVAFPRNGSKDPYVFLHRMIMGEPSKEFVVDHINGDTLDNRKSNLRIVDQKTNTQNRKPRENKVLGVSWHKSSDKWYAYAKIDGKMQSLGFFDNYEEAAKVATEYRKAHYAGWVDRSKDESIP